MHSKTDKLITRPPVVVVMGHIDHGKSTLLDYIRKTNTTEKEAGGITQHISAYEAEVTFGKEKREITFLDTPGHEAFCSLRERGARVADIAVLVVSADDGVKPQTLEAISCIKNDGIPFVVALNKIDKAGANIDKTKQSLAENDIFVEGWGGNIPMVAISAKTGENVPELLEIISIQADLEELKGDKSLPAEGFVVESNLNPKQGVSATLLIKNGTLKHGMFVAARGAYAPVRSIEDFRGKQIDGASFSSPVRITGWNAVPSVGEEFKTFNSKDEAVNFASQKVCCDEKFELKISQTYLPIIIKADTLGSLEAIEYELQKIGNEKISAKIISKGIGDISEKDVKTAGVKNSIILGFNINTDKSSEILAMRDSVEIKIFRIIYELIDFVKERLVSETPTENVEVTIGSAKILRTFSKNKDKQVVGGKVLEGEMNSGSSVKIYRREAFLGEGKIKEMQSQKIKTSSVKEGDEFGMMVESKVEIAGGDIVKATSIVKK